jgi:hypothetical protein
MVFGQSSNMEIEIVLASPATWRSRSSWPVHRDLMTWRSASVNPTRRRRTPTLGRTPTSLRGLRSRQKLSRPVLMVSAAYVSQNCQP